MLDVKTLLNTTITAAISTFTGLDKVATFASTAELLEDTEQIVFKDSAIGLGDVSIDKVAYSHSYDLNVYEVDCLLFMKSTAAEANNALNTTTLSNLLRQNNMSQSGVIWNELTTINPITNVTDRLKYKEMTILIKEVENIT